MKKSAINQEDFNRRRNTFAMAAFFKSLFNQSKSDPGLNLALRPAPPSIAPGGDVNRFRQLFSSLILSERKKALQELITYVGHAGGVAPVPGDGDPTTYLLQTVEPQLLLSEQITFYTTFAYGEHGDYTQNARLFKLIGLRLLWRSYRWRGMRYSEEADAAFTLALGMPNKEAAHTPFRIKDWRLKAQFLVASARGDDAGVTAVIADLNQIRKAFNLAAGQATFDSNLTEVSLMAALENEFTNNGRSADEASLGGKISDRICNDLFSIKYSGELNHDGAIYSPLLVDTETSTLSGTAVCFDTSALREPLVVDFIETPEGQCVVTTIPKNESQCEPFITELSFAATDSLPQFHARIGPDVISLANADRFVQRGFFYAVLQRHRDYDPLNTEGLTVVRCDIDLTFQGSRMAVGFEVLRRLFQENEEEKLMTPIIVIPATDVTANFDEREEEFQAWIDRAREMPK